VGNGRDEQPQNDHDGVLMGVRDPAARARLIVPLAYGSYSNIRRPMKRCS
jgi:hypothetical protein